MEFEKKCVQTMKSTFQNIGIFFVFAIILSMATISCTQTIPRSSIDSMEDTRGRPDGFYPWLPEDRINITSSEYDSLSSSSSDIGDMTGGFKPLTNVTIGNLTVPVCADQHVCYGKACGPYNGPFQACHCDDLCTFFNDCCPKFVEQPPVNCSTYESVNRTYIDSYDRSFFTCEAVKSNTTFGPNDYVFISKCPDTWNVNDIKEKCEVQSRLEDFSLEDIPLSFEDTITYRNVYCVICNGLDPQRLNPWNVDLICPEELVEDLKINPQPFEDILHNDQCRFSVNPVKVSGPAVRPCFKEESSCPLSSDLQFQEACVAMTAPIILDRENEWVAFRNPACYACKIGYFPDYNDMCPDYQNGRYSMSAFLPKEDTFNLSPISVLFDFSSESTIKLQVGETVVSAAIVACHSGEMFDPYAGKCLRLTCPKGYTIIKGECTRKVSEDEEICEWMRHDHYKAISFTVVSKDQGVCSDYAKDQRCDVQESFEALKLTSLSKCKEEASSDQYETHFVWDLERNYSAFWMDPIILEYSRRNMTKESCNFSTVSIFNRCAENNCDKSMVTSKNTSEMTKSVITKPSNEHHVSTNDDIGRDQFNVAITTYHVLQNRHDYVKSESRVVCDSTKSNFSCPSAIFNISLFLSEEDDGKLKYIPTGDVISPEEYVLLKNGRIRVCQFLSQNGTVNETTTHYFLHYSPAQTYLSFVSTSLSLVSLMITLLSYVVFPSLRKQVSNHLIMTLCGILILAQSLLMFGGLISKVSRHVCTVFAVASHFFWLTVFALSSMIALDLSRTFGSHETIRISTANRKLFCGYLSVAAGVPFLIVSIALTLSIVRGEDISLYYGDELSCWVGDELANLFVFGVPVLAFLSLNLFLFLKTIHGIARSKKISMSLHEGKKVSSYRDELLKIAIKVSSIMGFTWIFGFIAAFSKLEALWFIFIILNALQGVYIFLAFTANRRVFFLWRDLILKKLYGRRSSVPSEMQLRAKSGPSSVQTLSA